MWSWSREREQWEPEEQCCCGSAVRAVLLRSCQFTNAKAQCCRWSRASAEGRKWGSLWAEQWQFMNLTPRTEMCCMAHGQPWMSLLPDRTGNAQSWRAVGNPGERPTGGVAFLDRDGGGATVNKSQSKAGGRHRNFLKQFRRSHPLLPWATLTC